ncbi:enoyl-CoA hydratase/isomerase family protein [Nonomuraea turcica]|uniref:enoyl-CoA hydratase/isomerase family protein n=1 Tax=Nonomuraea sp. G32 TaxID=3067274 RepID=UPI00273AE7DE|nr:enoyl-CoA hydratase-related protein [Nonomuraea sp. G32]MDP4505339.1 enoyl-CoA hydratase-related protein [Nonomuraea sp. G32]
MRAERETRAVVLTGSRPHFFTGLNDVAGSLLWQRQAGLGVIDAGRQIARRLIWDLLDVEIPVIAALNGDAVSIGATIALLCDAVFMADTATLRDPHVQLGVAVGDGGQAIWPLVVGPALAKRYLLTGDPITAQNALRMGLVTHVSSADTVLAEATGFAQRLAAEAPLAVRYTKTAVNRLIKDAIAGAFEQGARPRAADVHERRHGRSAYCSARRPYAFFSGQVGPGC